MLRLVCLCLVAGALPPTVPGPVADKAHAERWAVILVGLSGDDEHETQFAETADAWQKSLTESLGFSVDHVLRLPKTPTRQLAEKDETTGPLTADTIRTTFSDLGKKLKADDALWVFTLGHGNYDGRRAWFHVAGRDPSDDDFGRWLSAVRCREQVIWLTHSSSGWFVKPLSKAGRIVISATAADDESNETEFPAALADVLEQPPKTLDADGDEKVSVAELFAAVVQEVQTRFKSDKRLPTEHAQLDDDGDGRGSEALSPVDDEPQAEPPPGATATAIPQRAKADGALARTTFVPFRVPIKHQRPVQKREGEAPAEPQASSEFKTRSDPDRH